MVVPKKVLEKNEISPETDSVGAMVGRREACDVPAGITPSMSSVSGPAPP